MNIIVIDPPDGYPVTLAELYSLLRLDPAGSPLEHPDDDMLTDMLGTATEKVEAATNRALLPQTIMLVLSEFDPDGVELKRPPLIDVVSVAYIATDGTEVTLDAEAYTVSDKALVPKLKPASAWPSTAVRDDAVRITYMVGHEPTVTSDPASGIPKSLKAAVKFEVQLQYDELSPEKRTQLEQTVARLIGHKRVVTF
jgi:uncharacterized phiE125 gp8 family phage protein